METEKLKDMYKIFQGKSWENSEAAVSRYFSKQTFLKVATASLLKSGFNTSVFL